MAITIEMNQKIQSLQIIDNIYVCVCVTTHSLFSFWELGLGAVR